MCLPAICGQICLWGLVMRMYANKNHIAAIVFLIFILCLAYLVYAPGLVGGFLFDDFINLEPLGDFGGVDNFETAKAFVFNGVSSSLGRPLSLVTFLLDDNTWPSHGSYFKPTNMKIHLINGVLVVWSTLLVLRALGKSESDSVWIAVLAGAMWLLHPYMVSTTLYVIQRMAQLSAMFMLAGICAYLKGRAMLMGGRLIAGYIWMSAGAAIGTVLAILSKENGALLPLCILVIESVFPKPAVYLFAWWKVCFLVIPSLLVIGYLISMLDFSNIPASGRRYSILERLITEPRIVWEYIYHLLVPRIEGRGLFQDGYVFSRSLLNPITTLPSIIGIVVLLVLGLIYRSRFPLICLAILFFLASHLMESTWINLELYFEHRNYIASVFIFLPIAASIVHLKEKHHYKISVIAGLGVLSVLTFLTHNRVALWSDSDKLELYWAVSSTDSPRAQNRLGALLLKQSGPEHAIAHMERASKRFPDSSLITSNLLLIKVFSATAVPGDFERAANEMRDQPFDAQAVMGLRHIANQITLPDAPESYAAAMIKLTDEVYKNKNYREMSVYSRIDHYIKGLMYLKLRDDVAAYESFSKAIDAYNETDAALSIVAEMAGAGYSGFALNLLLKAEKVYQNQPDNTLIRSRDIYDKEFARMREMLNSVPQDTP